MNGTCLLKYWSWWVGTTLLGPQMYQIYYKSHILEYITMVTKYVGLDSLGLVTKSIQNGQNITFGTEILLQELV